MNSLKILVSAYACKPGQGSDPGIGWNVSRELARQHEVWVITRNDNRFAIETELTKNPVPNLHFVFYDLPTWARLWKRGQRGVYLHYYLWQIGIYSIAKELHCEVGFDIVHHVTYVKHWGPSFLSLLGVPFVWGPVGGGESAPKTFWHDFNARGKVYEILRDVARWLGEKDIFVHLTARRSTVAFAATQETGERLFALGCKRVEICGVAGIPKSDFDSLAALPPAGQKPFRLISIGRLLHWKGFYLGLRAFAKLNLPDAEYWIIGDGPDRSDLETLAKELGISNQVRFWGAQPREKTLSLLGECHALVHPSLHDSGGWVCLEAMAAGRPVICLELGGPATQVTEETGFKVPAPEPEQAVQNLAGAMAHLASNPDLQVNLGQAGQRRVKQVYDWGVKGQYFTQLYEEILSRAVETSA
ncbi:glycosyltransferase family 4 protein [Scytonema sp. NUACC26]|uniref:glycosyltransferase family 4 protein n=1 Tax=Scytonema sp. NUACC26 TaxID=3140176 RepID=UPI0034DC2C1F